MSEFTFDLPELHEQRAIADVLGALDDKIAANTRLAATAVELAAALFTEALTAARWTTHTFDELAVVSGGGTPSTKVPEYWGGSTNWATPSDVTALSAPYLARTDRMITEAGLAACSSRLFEPGAILMTSRATIGAFAIARAPLAVNQGFIVVEPRDPAMRYWLFHEMKSRVDEFISMANGATFLELSRGKFKPLRVRLADPGTMSVFDRRASALHDAAFEAAEESRTLVALRDLLLPRLMSGEVRAHVDRSE